MNMTLDGLEKTIEAKFGKRNSRQALKNKVYPTRYADDFMMTGNSKEILENEALPVITEFLKLRGLELSKEKTRIIHIKEGFNFLGWNIRKYKNNGKEPLLIKPSKESVKQVLAKVKATLKQNQQARQLKVIQ
jgi:RNA-directed DNA polymerase